MKITQLIYLGLVASTFSLLACVAPAEETAPAEDSTETASGALVSRGGGGTSTSFECNTPGFPGLCSCDGPLESQDCQDMAINCADEIKCGLFVDNCVCTMWRVSTPPPKSVPTPSPSPTVMAP